MKNEYRISKGSIGSWLFFVLSIISFGCTSNTKSFPERPRDPWVMRSVLDQQVRMVTLALHEEGYAAYNAETGALYKVWKGGVHWDGAAFNNVKTVQPESYGPAYWEAPIQQNPWKARQNGQAVDLKIQFRGYRLENNQVTLQCELLLPDGHLLNVEEQPELVLTADGKVQFTRTFTTKNVPEGLTIQNGELQLPVNGTDIQIWTFDPFPDLDPEVYARHVSSSGSQYWLDRSGCSTCHKEDEVLIGPAFQQIAARYENDKKTVDFLVQRVIEGGYGSWGTVPMNPHPDLPRDDIRRMVNYILSLKPTDAQASSPKPVATKKQEEQLPDPGFGAALTGLHPSLKLHTIRPKGFKPRVGGMDFLPDGRLLVSTWDSIGAVYALSGLETNDTNQVKIQRIASGLSEPLGLKVVDGSIFVLQKHELTRLIDHDGDGITDEYRTVCNSFEATPDFHEFSYGLEYKDGYFYANLGLAMRLMSHELQLPDRGTVIRIDPDGQHEVIAEGLRQPNGIGFGPDGALFILENQGRWVPSCKVIHVQEGAFYGCYLGRGDRFAGREVTPPAVWLPQNEIGNSPSQPVLIKSGAYQGQMLHGEVTHGGLKRVFLEKVNGNYQGAVFRFTQGLEAGINRVAYGSDGALYVGGVGMNGNWAWNGAQYGLQKLEFTDQPAFEIHSLRALPNGFELTMTEALAADQELSAASITVQQWKYVATPQYGGPKIDLQDLNIRSLTLSEDRTRIEVVIPGLMEGYVIYFLLPKDLKSTSGQSLWSGEAWYTLNSIPENL